MKKTLLTLSAMLLSVASLFAAATTFTETITITMNGDSIGSQQAQIEVEIIPDGTANFALKNFCMGTLPIGTIKMQGATVTNVGYDKIAFCDSILIENGDTPGVSYWMGPSIGKIPVLLKAKIHGNSLIAYVDINLGDIQQGGLGLVQVAIGSEDIISTKTFSSLPVIIDLGVAQLSQTGEIVVEYLEDGEINFIQKNFSIEQMLMDVGTITIRDTYVTKDHNCLTLNVKENILISAGDDATKTWMGPSLGFIPISGTGKVAENNLFVTLGITTDVLSIPVTIGTDFDAIENIQTEQQHSTSIYNLSGARVANMNQHGIYIVNGKKVMK